MKRKREDRECEEHIEIEKRKLEEIKRKEKKEKQRK